jgi:hypothetical protein
MNLRVPLNARNFLTDWEMVTSQKGLCSCSKYVPELHFSYDSNNTKCSRAFPYQIAFNPHYHYVYNILSNTTKTLSITMIITTFHWQYFYHMYSRIITTAWIISAAFNKLVWGANLGWYCQIFWKWETKSKTQEEELQKILRISW